ncbi:MAG TPA: hypothetical protein VEV81_11195, partial [Pyrinomonadaceae bacterium]|nr:hypothetical protein [Pyrinomonadaceae bacterium]
MPPQPLPVYPPPGQPQGYGAAGAAYGGYQPPPPMPPHQGQGIHMETDPRGQGRGFSYEVKYQPSYSLAVIQLQPEQSILAEAGAMVSMS